MVGFGPFRNPKGLDDSVAPHRRMHVIEVQTATLFLSRNAIISKLTRLSFDGSLEAKEIDFIKWA